MEKYENRFIKIYKKDPKDGVLMNFLSDKCESDMLLYKWNITWKYDYIPFNI